MDHNVVQLLAAAKNGDMKTVNRLFVQGVDLNSRDQNNIHAIQNAARGGHNELILYLLSTGLVSVDSAGKENESALHGAIFNKRYTTVELLLNKGANCNHPTSSGNTALHTAIMTIGNCCSRSTSLKCVFSDKRATCPLIAEEFEKLPDELPMKCVFAAIAALMVSSFGADVSIRGKFGITPTQLIRQKYAGWEALATYLESFTKKRSVDRRSRSKSRSRLLHIAPCIERAHKVRLGATPLKSAHCVLVPRLSAADGLRSSPLHAACSNCDITEVKRLIFKRVDLNERDNDGNSALHKTVERNNTQVSLLLLEHGANINAVNDQSRTALHVAVEKVALECIDVLLEHKCDVAVQDAKGNTALMNAVSKVYEEDAFEKQRQETIIEILSESGTDFDIKDEKGLNCVHLAAKFGNEFAIKVFAKMNPSELIRKDNYGNQPLHQAANVGSTSVVQTLLKTDLVNVNDEGIHKRTALHGAVFRSQFVTVELLIQNNASSNTCDHIGRTPLHNAFIKFDHCCVKSKSECCKSIAKVTDSPLISQIFNALPTDFPKKCVFLAVAEFLIKAGDADIFIEDINGRSPINLIVGDIAEKAYIVSYFTYLNCRNIRKIQEQISRVESTLCSNRDHFEDDGKIRIMDNYTTQIEEIKTDNLVLLKKVDHLESVVNENQITISSLSKQCPSKISLKNVASNENESIVDHQSDIIKALQSLMKKDAEIEKLRAENEKMSSVISENKVEISELKSRNEYLVSMVYCTICKKAQKSLKLLCGHEMCDDCEQKYDRCIICRDENDAR